MDLAAGLREPHYPSTYYIRRAFAMCRARFRAMSRARFRRGCVSAKTASSTGIGQPAGLVGLSACTIESCTRAIAERLRRPSCGPCLAAALRLDICAGMSGSDFEVTDAHVSALAHLMGLRIGAYPDAPTLQAHLMDLDAQTRDFPDVLKAEMLYQALAVARGAPQELVDEAATWPIDLAYAVLVRRVMDAIVVHNLLPNSAPGPAGATSAA